MNRFHLGDACARAQRILFFEVKFTIQLMQGDMETQETLQPCVHTVPAQIIIVLLTPILTHELEVKT